MSLEPLSDGLIIRNPVLTDSNPVIVLSRSPMVDVVLQYLSPGDVARLQCTCRIISDALIAWRRAAYNINRFLQRFFKDPVAFRILQAQTNLLVSGSSALQFMDRYVMNITGRIDHSSSDHVPPACSASSTRTAIWTSMYHPRAHEKL
jgi:hypothetical protein